MLNLQMSIYVILALIGVVLLITGIVAGHMALFNLRKDRTAEIEKVGQTSRINPGGNQPASGAARSPSVLSTIYRLAQPFEGSIVFSFFGAILLLFVLFSQPMAYASRNVQERQSLLLERDKLALEYERQRQYLALSNATPKSEDGDTGSDSSNTPGPASRKIFDGHPLSGAQGLYVSAYLQGIYRQREMSGMRTPNEHELAQLMEPLGTKGVVAASAIPDLAKHAADKGIDKFIDVIGDAALEYLKHILEKKKSDSDEKGAPHVVQICNVYAERHIVAEKPPGGGPEQKGTGTATTKPPVHDKGTCDRHVQGS